MRELCNRILLVFHCITKTYTYIYTWNVYWIWNNNWSVLSEHGFVYLAILKRFNKVFTFFRVDKAHLRRDTHLTKKEIVLYILYTEREMYSYITLYAHHSISADWNHYFICAHSLYVCSIQFEYRTNLYLHFTIHTYTLTPYTFNRQIYNLLYIRYITFPYNRG